MTDKDLEPPCLVDSFDNPDSEIARQERIRHLRETGTLIRDPYVETLRKRLTFKPWVPDELMGPPLLVRSIEELDTELARQTRLRDARLLRRHDGVTWAWTKCERTDGSHAWVWISSGNSMPIVESACGREDHDAAWAAVTKAPKSTGKPPVDVDLTGKYFAVADGAPVLLGLAGSPHLYLPCFASKKAMESFLLDHDVTVEGCKEIVDHREFLLSCPRATPSGREVRIIIYPWVTPEGRVRYVELFRN